MGSKKELEITSEDMVTALREGVREGITDYLYSNSDVITRAIWEVFEHSSVHHTVERALRDAVRGELR